MKKITVFLPQNKEQILSCYPFLQEITNLYPDGEIHLLILEELKKYLLFFEKNFFIHTYNLEDYNVAGLYKYIYNLKRVNNIDIYIDLVGTLASATIGIFVKANQRIGLDKGMARFLYNQRIQISTHMSSERIYLNLLRKWNNKSDENFFISRECKDVNPFEGPLVQNRLISQEFTKGYFLCLIDSLGDIKSELYQDGNEREDTTEEHFWRSFFESFTDQRFVVFSEKIDVELSDFLKSLTSRNDYFHQRGHNLEDLSALLDYSSAVLTDSSFYSSVGIYFQKPVFLLRAKNLELPLSYYIKNRPFVVKVDGERYEVTLGKTKRSLSSINQVVDLVHEVLKI
ncbi:MAG: glycosyltransferase family 9 protein [Bacteriovoracaceae bacterium]